MQEPLASITERFANNQQTLADSLAMCEARLMRDAQADEWKARFSTDTSTTRVLCTDNNSKAALNWEFVKWLRVDADEWCHWAAEDDAGVAHNEVIEQLEPQQCAWAWMPVVCLENYPGT